MLATYTYSLKLNFFFIEKILFFAMLDGIYELYHITTIFSIV